MPKHFQTSLAAFSKTFSYEKHMYLLASFKVQYCPFLYKVQTNSKTRSYSVKNYWAVGMPLLTHPKYQQVFFLHSFIARTDYFEPCSNKQNLVHTCHVHYMYYYQRALLEGLQYSRIMCICCLSRLLLCSAL